LNQRINCHRIILKISPYLDVLLRIHDFTSPGAREYNLREEREDIFRIILAYLYECDIDLTALNYEQRILILERAHFYILPDLVELAKIHVEYGLNYENVLNTIYFAYEAEEICVNFIKKNIKELMSFNEFVKKLSKEQLIYIFNDLGHDLYLNELEVYQWIENWMKFHLILSEGENLKEKFK
jgi:hypothetical protein